MKEEQNATSGEVPPTDQSWLGKMPIIVFAVATSLIVSYAASFAQAGWSTKPDSWGQFGDFLGGVLNPLISLFTLSVAVKVWQLQKTELGQTRNALEDQLKTAEQQRAEARFFDLLNLYQLTLGSISKSVEGGRLADSSIKSKVFGESAAYATVVTGRSVFQYIFDREIRRFLQGGKPNDNAEDLNHLWKGAKDKWQNESEQIDHYFRTVFMVLREAEKTLGQDHHYRYVKMFRAQLSREELALLAFNMLLDDEGKKMRVVAAKYGILKHLAHNRLRQEVEETLEPNIFGRSYVKISS